MTSKAVAQSKAAEVPDLVRTPALDIGAEDVALPRLHIGQYSSKAVQRKLVEAGAIFSSIGQEDDEPITYEQPLKFYVLTLQKGKSFSEEPGAPLERYAYDDPDAPAGAWVTYDYTIAVPSEAEDVPFKFLFTKTGRPAAQQLNTILVRNAQAGPPWHLAFEVRSAPRDNPKGAYFIPRVRQTEADDNEVKVAEHLGMMLSPAATEVGSTGEQPDI